MLQRVTDYCNQFFQRLLSRDPFPPRRLLFDEKFLLTTHATVVYNVDQRGYFGIVADSGERFFAINGDEFPRFLKDRLRIHVTLRYYPGVADFYRFGIVAKIVGIEPSFEARASHTALSKKEDVLI